MEVSLPASPLVLLSSRECAGTQAFAGTFLVPCFTLFLALQAVSGEPCAWGSSRTGSDQMVCNGLTGFLSAGKPYSRGKAKQYWITRSFLAERTTFFIHSFLLMPIHSPFLLPIVWVFFLIASADLKEKPISRDYSAVVFALFLQRAPLFKYSATDFCFLL